MSEFAPISISFLISLLVSLILFYVSLAINQVAPNCKSKKKCLRPLSPHGIQFVLIITFLSFFYLICIILLSVEIFQAMFWKIGLSLGAQTICSFFRAVGCPVTLTMFLGFAVRAFLTSESTPFFGMPAASGSDSSCWEKYLNLSSEKEGIAESESSTGHNPGHRPQERGANAPGIAREAGQGGATDMGPAAPSIEFLLKKIPSVLRGCQRVAVRRSFCTTIFEDLHLLDASPQKRLQIMEVLREIENNREIFLNNPNLKAAYHLMVSVNDWEREQRNSPNPVDDVP